jgi:general secretion pathway protein G
MMDGPMRSCKRTPSRLARRPGGFTLLELMVVVLIIGMLAALVVPRVADRPDEARATAARHDIATLVQALRMYRLDNRDYPSTEQGLEALVRRPETGPLPSNWRSGGYLERLPLDPWGQPYRYLNPGLRGDIDVFSLGADGAPGGDGRNADIGSWAS